MAFETQNGLPVDGVAGPAVWRALLADAAARKADGLPVTYVLVSKGLPQHLTVWVNGVLAFADVPCNTGVPGAATADGTFAVFEHVQVSNMRGTDVTGTQYDVTVPWASYFNGGDALHGGGCSSPTSRAARSTRRDRSDGIFPTSVRSPRSTRAGRRFQRSGRPPAAPPPSSPSTSASTSVPGASSPQHHGSMSSST
jgi:peptidoglycan hydrolase-like protein with peptidoglycan-binding domain